MGFSDVSLVHKVQVPGLLVTNQTPRHAAIVAQVSEARPGAPAFVVIFRPGPPASLRIRAYRGTHLDLLYHRLAPNKGHGRAVVAVARHLAEASYWVLRKSQPYKAPAPRSLAA